jgi:hypothetical protein
VASAAAERGDTLYSSAIVDASAAPAPRDAGKIVDESASPPDGDGVRGLAARAAMWGPRFVG